MTALTMFVFGAITGSFVTVISLALAGVNKEVEEDDED